MFKLKVTKVLGFNNHFPKQIFVSKSDARGKQKHFLKNTIFARCFSGHNWMTAYAHRVYLSMMSPRETRDWEIAYVIRK